MDDDTPEPGSVRFNDISRIVLGPSDILFVRVPVRDIPPNQLGSYMKKVKESLKAAFNEMGRPGIPILVASSDVSINIIEAVASLESIPTNKNAVIMEPRLCEESSCRMPLPPGWTAVYCSTNCALADA